ncbi:hypothetical protein GH714_015188 [Hevea brasiliensis]|uniref:RNase H type-1 domain-containing protein n=1 Tax=Hevea brasiliensis TaxID=3981 RepID=A0A6A6MDN0_HEVBR|nr:hypothetical protein GH714_015188 [Hevea brasiliensis]
MVLSASVIGTLLRLRTQMYTNALGKLPYMAPSMGAYGLILQRIAIQPIPEDLLNETVASNVTAAGQWDWGKFGQFLPASSILYLTAIPPPLSSQVEDSLFWASSSSSQFTIKSTYQHLLGILSSLMTVTGIGFGSGRVRRESTRLKDIIVESDNLIAVQILVGVLQPQGAVLSVVSTIQFGLTLDWKVTFFHVLLKANYAADWLAGHLHTHDFSVEVLDTPLADLIPWLMHYLVNVAYFKSV